MCERPESLTLCCPLTVTARTCANRRAPASRKTEIQATAFINNNFSEATVPKQITPEQALSASFTPLHHRKPKGKDKEGNPVFELVEAPRFIKPGERQDAALKRLKSSALGRTKKAPAAHRIPSFIPGKTSTATYVADFENMNGLVATGSAEHLTNPAPIPEGPEVEVLL